MSFSIAVSNTYPIESSSTYPFGTTGDTLPWIDPYQPYYPPYYPRPRWPSFTQQGWECPRCGVMNNPNNATCAGCSTGYRLTWDFYAPTNVDLPPWTVAADSGMPEEE